MNDLFPGAWPIGASYVGIAGCASVGADRAIERLQEKAEELRELAELDAPYEADRLSWDDTPEGERLRRYGLTCQRAWSRMFDLLLKIRTKAGELDIATVASIRRSVPTVTTDAIDQWAIRCGRHHPPRGARPSPIRRSKPIWLAEMRRTKPIRMFRRPVRNTGMGKRGQNRHAAPRPQTWRNRDNRQSEEPSGARAGTGGPEVDADEPVADLRRAVRAALAAVTRDHMPRAVSRAVGEAPSETASALGSHGGSPSRNVAALSARSVGPAT